MMKIITQILRVFVGGLFIYSGFIKANDTIGFSYKMEEYFTEVFHMDFMVPFALFAAMFICIFEIALGMMLLLGTRLKLTLWLSFLMILFFTFLTFYSAYFDKVKTCGCFGDAWKLTPWQSFIKDLILFTSLIFILIGRKHIVPLIKNRKAENVILVFVIITSTAFPLYTYNYLPIKDYREYRIGTDMYKAIHYEVKYYYLLTNKTTGEQKEFEAWPPNWDKEWKYDTVRTEPKDENIKPIIGYSMQKHKGEDYTDEFLQKEGLKFILVEYNLDKAATSVQGKINDFAAMCKNENIEFVALTSSDTLKQKTFIATHKISYPFYTNADDVPLKTMIRSNPGLILLKKSTVIEMWHYNSFPSFSDVKANYLSK